MKKLSMLVFCIFFIGCASTGYKAAQKTTKYGYFDNNVQDNYFDVQFKGNSHTEMDKACDYALLRCSEVCLQNNYETFTIINSQDVSKVKSENHAYGNAYGSYNYGFGTATSYTTTKTYPCILMRIECFKDLSGNYKAKQIRDNLIKKHNIKELKTKYNLQ